MVTWYGIRVDGGWPARSMAWARRFHFEPTSGAWEEHATRSIALPDDLRPDADWFEPPRDRLPLRPILPGFVINTIFYAIVVAAILALPLSVFPMRRYLRARRGRCAKCGYDRTGLAEATVPCPECGATR